MMKVMKGETVEAGSGKVLGLARFYTQSPQQ